MAELQLPKLIARVRFPSSALFFTIDVASHPTAHEYVPTDHNDQQGRTDRPHRRVVVHPFRLDEEGARSPTCERPNC